MIMCDSAIPIMRALRSEITVLFLLSDNILLLILIASKSVVVDYVESTYAQVMKVINIEEVEEEGWSTRLSKCVV